MSSPDNEGSSTHPYSSTTLQRIHQELTQAAATTQRDSGKLSGVTPAELEPSQLMEEFQKISIDAVPGTRILLAHPPWAASLADAADSAAVSLAQTIASWSVVGVMQRTGDIGLTIDVELPNDGGCKDAIPRKLELQLYYEPRVDSCVVRNTSTSDTVLESIDDEDEEACTRLVPAGLFVMKPGLWRIKAEGSHQKAQDVHVVDMLLLRRCFTVDIQSPDAQQSGGSAKRRASSPGYVPGQKRQKQGADVTEIIVAPVANRVTAALSILRPDRNAIDGASSSQQAVSGSAAHVLDLKDNDLALIRCSDADPESTYTLERLEHIAQTRAATVIAVRHSALDADVVAKIVKRRAEPLDLVRCAEAWKREQSFLKDLNHPNIIGLKAFDGRQFAIYVELLPRCLHRGVLSDLTAKDARIILQDTSSALAYLASKKVAHNDIKPANVAYSERRGAVLLDFGLAGEKDKRSSGGTPWYRPPEAADARGGGKIGTAGDVWAMGITMLYVLRKTRIPENITPAWNIREVSMRGSKAHVSMMAWLDVVRDARNALDRHGDNMVEWLVRAMLETDPRQRISGAGIVAAFEKPLETERPSD